MNKIGLVSLVIVISCFLTATALGLQNGTVPESQNETPEPPEVARDKAVEYVLQAHEELVSIQAPSEWEMRNLSPGLLGASNIQYTSGGWNVTVSYPVVLSPTYTVEVNYTGDLSFKWAGTVDQNWTVAETDFALVQ